MIRTKVEILRNTHPDSEATALIRLYDTWIVPRDATFRIEPLDDEEVGEADDWPRGDLQPVATRVTADGVELLIGASITDASGLLPGTPVVVSIPASSVREEVRWPNIPASRSSARVATVMSGEQRLAVLKERARQAEIAAASAVADLPALSELERPDRPVTKPPDHAIEGDLSASLATLGSLSGESSREGSLPQMIDDGSAENAETDRQVSTHSDEDVSAPGEQGAAGPVHAVQPPLEPPLPSRGIAGDESRPPSSGVSSVQPVLTGQAAGPVILAPTSETKGDVAPGRRSRADEPVEAQARNHRKGGGRGLSFALGALSVALVGAGLWYSKPHLATSLGTKSVVTQQAPVERPASTNSTSLSALLDVPTVSPKGVAASGVTFTEALRRADAALHDGRSREDRLEARYWLRRALALGFGETRTAWALSQLGSLFASPDVTNPPDFEAARSLWELAASGGDPTSTCFIAALHEHGISVPKNPGLALNIYLRAKDRGGCPNLEEAISRLQKGAP